MAEEKSPSPQDRAQSAAEKLRALRDRASQTLDSHRKRLGALESELSQRVQQLADDFDAGSQQAHVETLKDAEIASLKEQLVESQAKHQLFTEKLLEARRQLEELQAETCSTCDQSAAELAAAREEIARLKADLAAAVSQHDADKQRLDLIVAQLAAARGAIDNLAKSSDVRVAELTDELESLRAAKEASDAAAEATADELQSLRTECDALAETIATLSEQSDEALAQGESLQQQLAEALSQCEHAQAERQGLKAAFDDAQATVVTLRGELTAAMAERDSLAASASASAAEQAAAANRMAGDLAAAVAEQERLESELSSTAARLTDLDSALTVTSAERDDRDATIAELRSGQSGAEARLTAANHELTALKEQLAATSAELATARDELVAAEQKLAAAATEIGDLKSGIDAVNDKSDASAERHAKLQAKFAAVQQELAELKRAAPSDNALSDAQRQRDEAVETARRSEDQRAELVDALREAQSHIERLLGTMCPQSAFDELQQKFDLALADVQMLKRENGALREAVASRPAADGEASPELAALRAERDELAVRVQELEDAAPVACDPNQQDMSDLQRRFELAVDDVRQLKKENAELREKLSTGSGVVTQGASCPLDWASQKARLLQMLQNEDDAEVDAARETERATVQGTIAATDRVVAEKDSEIAELLVEVQKLQELLEQPRSDEGAAAEEILSADALVAAERDKLTVLQSQWEEKLRAAELEFAVERANLARQQAALREKQLELDRLAQQADGADGGESKRRRRWLDALGLRDEEEKK